MKKGVKYLVIIMMVPMISHQSLGQDHHFSQLDAVIQYMNPALTGMTWNENFNWRLNTAYRTQWVGLVSKPYTNQFIGFDSPWKKGLGFGGYIINDRAGTGQMNTLNIMLGMAYKITIDPTNKHNMYGGFNIGLLNRTVNISNLVFDSQFYIGSSGYEVSADNNENIGNQSLWRFDANMGLYYRYNDKQIKYSPWGGFSLYRITMPNESFTSEVNRMPLHLNLMGGCDIAINENSCLKPSFIIMFQGKAREYLPILIYEYKFDNSPWTALTGIADRIKDAAIFYVGAKYDESQFRLSYDVNTSFLKNYTHSFGAVEFSIIIVYDKNKPIFNRLLK